MEQAQKNRSVFAIVSWIALTIVFVTLVWYAAAHIEDMLDSDMASEMILAKHLSQSGTLLSTQWYYSTEIRIVNTQLFYAFFFHFTNDWQLVRILGNVSLYLVFLASFFFLCKRLKIEKYFPICAAILLLPLSEDYTAVMLYGAYYIPRISMMFVILGTLIPSGTAQKNSRVISSILFCMACILSFALGLEGPRMILILFLPITVLVGFESVAQLREYHKNPVSEPYKLGGFLKRTGFLTYLAHSFVACFSALLGFVIHELVLAKAYAFYHFPLSLKISFSNIKATLTDQLAVIGNSSQNKVIPITILCFAALLILYYLCAKFRKSLISKRFIGFCMISYAAYFAFCFVVQMSQVPRYIIPVAILLVPAVAVVIGELPVKQRLKNAICAVLFICFLFIGIPGYRAFYARHEREYYKIAAVLEKEQYVSGYSSFWSGNVLTELSDGQIEIWTVLEFDEQTAKSPDLFLWLQDKAHDHALPTKKSFIIWSKTEYDAYHDQNFDYVGREIYRSDQFVVFELKQ